MCCPMIHISILREGMTVEVIRGPVEGVRWILSYKEKRTQRPACSVLGNRVLKHSGITLPYWQEPLGKFENGHGHAAGLVFP